MTSKKKRKEEKHTHRAHIYRERYICYYHNKLKRNENKSSDSAFLYYKIEGRRDRTGREQSEKKYNIYRSFNISDANKLIVSCDPINIVVSQN